MGIKTAWSPFSSSLVCLNPPARQPQGHAVICEPHECVAVGKGRYAFNTYLPMPPFWLEKRSNSNPSNAICFITKSGGSNIFDIKCIMDGLKRRIGISGICAMANAGWAKIAHHLFLVAGHIESSCNIFCWSVYPVVLQNSLRIFWTQKESFAAGVHSSTTMAVWLVYAIRRVPVNEVDLASLFSFLSPRVEKGWHEIPALRIWGVRTTLKTSLVVLFWVRSPSMIGTSRFPRIHSQKAELTSL